ncbi:hypothetical protein CPB83DRAFT_884063, partial [Crepidotus variabilis]
MQAVNNGCLDLAMTTTAVQSNPLSFISWLSTSATVETVVDDVGKVSLFLRRESRKRMMKRATTPIKAAPPTQMTPIIGPGFWPKVFELEDTALTVLVTGCLYQQRGQTLESPNFVYG